MTLAIRASLRDGAPVESATAGRPRPAPGVATGHAPDPFARARLLWPRLEPPHDAAVRRDPERLALHVARRTALPIDAIRALLAR